MKEPEFEPFDDAALVGHGTTAQEQSKLKAKAASQAKPPRPIDIVELPAVYKRPDNQPRAAIAELRKFVVARLLEHDPDLRAQEAVIYTDLWLEYIEATDSIDTNGMICLHPRTPIIIENPYLPKREKARQGLAQIRNIDAPWLWDHDNLERARRWLDAATADREKRLTTGERDRKNQMEGTKD